MSVSELAGNTSSLLATLAYLMTDILGLRCLAIASQALAICFQYFRPVSLWIPIRWNILLLGINTTMATRLIWERRRAERMSPAQEMIFKAGMFEKRGFNRVEFLRLMELATNVSFEAGHVVAKEGEVKTAL